MAEFMGGEFMLGTDFSHHQWNKNTAKRFNPAYADFVLIKATEGKTYVDPAMNDWLQLIADTRGETGAPFIFFYHYARPENNEPGEEAQHFIETIEHHLGNCGIALDWEDKAHTIDNGNEWAVEWLKQVKSATGNKTIPLFYTSGAYTRYYKKVADAGFPLWVAHYGTTIPRVESWEKPTMWQFTSKPFDMNIFFGSPADMVKLIHNN